jgi:topoisomerase-4 subunit A
MRNTKLYVSREEGFVGTSLRREEYVTDCADIDDVIVFTADGKMMVTKVESKTFVGKTSSTWLFSKRKTNAPSTT